MRSLALVLTLCLETAVALQSTSAAQPPLVVVGSVPANGDSDVRRDQTIRVTFSREVDTASFDGRIVVQYPRAESAERGEPQPPDVKFRTSYEPNLRVLEITPSELWERFRDVRVELLDGIAASDGGVLSAWTLTFRTGGS